MNPLARLDGPAVETPPFAGRVVPAIEAARESLLSCALPGGYWTAEVEGDVGPAADCILMENFIGTAQPDRLRKIANYIVERQTAEGGWSLYEGGSPDVDLVVKAYFALKLAGRSADAPEMRRAREAALALGGAEATGPYTRFYLALFRQFDWSGVPAIPPEIVFLPRFCFANIYDVAAWARAALVPLSIVWAHRPRRPLPTEAGISELFIGPRKRGAADRPSRARLRRDPSWFSLRNLFLFLDDMLRRLDHVPIRPLRSRALRQAEKWMIERLEKSGGFGRAHPVLLNTILALHCLDYPHDHPLVAKALAEFYAGAVEQSDTLRFRTFDTPVADTALACQALVAAGVPTVSDAVVKAREWLVGQQAREPGDWRQKNPKADAGGWPSETSNALYPSVGTTAGVLLALRKNRAADIRTEGGRRLEDALQRGLAWLRSMQSATGGFAAFDRDSGRRLLSYAPLARQTEILDAACADVTGRSLEAMAALGEAKNSAGAGAAIAYLRRTQAPDGCWTGRWAVNGIYGTYCALRGLATAGEDMREGYVVRAIEWLRAVQNPDGGWGESCASYEDADKRGVGPSSATQTAWALMAFFAFGDFHSISVRRGVEYLLSRQTAGGEWPETNYTATRIPRVSYTRNNLYALCFPLLCLAEYARATALLAASASCSEGSGGAV